MPLSVPFGQCMSKDRTAPHWSCACHCEVWFCVMLTLIINAAATWAMVGLIWLIQLVHYPLMAYVSQGFGAFHQAHAWRISWLVGPLMGLELATSLALLSVRPAGVPAWSSQLGLVLVLVCWGVTAVFSVPAHSRLSAGRDKAALGFLVKTNWLRTAAWSTRGILVAWMLLRATAKA